ncbi:hypothetical protein LINPERPRIM_LOCUS17900 [Linum perenne]
MMFRLTPWIYGSNSTTSQPSTNLWKILRQWPTTTSNIRKLIGLVCNQEHGIDL